MRNVFKQSRFNAIALITVSLLLMCADASARQHELVVLNWADYVDPDLVEQFEHDNNVKIKWMYFEGDDARDAILVSSHATGIDIALVNDVSLSLYQASGWLAPISAKEVPSLKYIDPKRLENLGDASGYSVPYFWGTLGIAYRKDLYPVEVTSWQQILQPDESLQGKIVMMSSARDVIGMALKALGYSANSNNPKELKEAEALLRKQKPYVSRYNYIAITEESTLLSGETWMSMAFNGDVLTLNEYSNDIHYVIPKEGGNVWTDHLVIMNKSTNKDLAYEFVDFLNQPKNAAKNAEFVYFATPNVEALKLVSDEYRNNRVIFPTSDQVETSERYQKVSARVSKFRNRVMADLLK